MRIVSLFAFLIALPVSQLTGQVMEDIRNMTLGTQPALTVMLPGASTKFAETAWKDYVNSYGKLASVKKSKESVLAGIQILEISTTEKLNVYNLAEPSGNDAKMIVWFEMGDKFVSAAGTPEAYPGAVKFLQHYAHKVQVDQAQLEADAQQKELEKRQDELAKLQRENTGLHKLIADMNDRIVKNEANIQTNLSDQESTRNTIQTAQTQTLDDKQQKELSKQLRRLDKLERDNSNYHKTIADSRDRIAKAERDIQQNLIDQEKAKAEVEAQEKVVADAQQRLLSTKAAKPD